VNAQAVSKLSSHDYRYLDFQLDDWLLLVPRYFELSVLWSREPEVDSLQ